MRKFTFPVSFAGGDDDIGRVILTTGPSETADGLLADGFFVGDFAKFAGLLGLAFGHQARFGIAPEGISKIIISLGGETFDQPWAAATMLNLIDSSTFLGQDDEPFLSGVQIEHRSLRKLSIEESYLALDSFVANCRDHVTAMIAPSGVGQDSKGEIWPKDPSKYFFDIDVKLPRTLTAREKEVLQHVMTDLDTLSAHGAFVVDADLRNWLDEGRIPYAAEFIAARDTLSIRIEMPASDLAPAIFLLEKVIMSEIEEAGVNWSFNIREGW